MAEKLRGQDLIDQAVADGLMVKDEDGFYVPPPPKKKASAKKLKVAGDMPVSEGKKK